MSKTPRLFVLFQEKPPLGSSKPVRHFGALTQFGWQFLFAEKAATKLTAAEVRTIRREWATASHPVRVRCVGKGLGDDFKPVAEIIREGKAQGFPCCAERTGIAA